jgi:isopenicillin-N N-acyltransferase like protein
MRTRSRQSILSTLAFLLASSATSQPRAAQPPAETVTVSKTFNNSPFDYNLRLLAKRADFRIFRLTYPSPVVSPVKQNNTIPADYYVPNSIRPDDTKRPAVICLHILDGNEPLTDLVCSMLAKRGIPAIAFKLPYYGSRGSAKGPQILADNPKLFAGAIVQSGEDIRRTVDLLASRPEVNPERIGIVGISLGGIISASAAGAEPRIHRTGLILAGGDLLTIIRHARETRDLSKTLQKLPPAERSDVETNIAAADPLKFAPALRQRAQDGRVLMINAAVDEVIPRKCTEKLAKALGISDRVVWLEGLGHYTAIAELPRALRMTADFFAQDLPDDLKLANQPGTDVPSPGGPAPLERVVTLLQQAVTILATEPEPGRCHYLDFELDLALPVARGQPITSNLRLIRGTQGKFLFQGKLPEVGQFALGQGRFPWMLADAKTVLAGTKNPVKDHDVLHYVEPRHLMKLRMVSGLVGTIALVPDMLQQWITVGESQAAGGGSSVRVAAKDAKKLPAEIRLIFESDGHAPTEAVVNFAGTDVGRLRIHGWQPNAIASDAMFEPPEGNQLRKVDQLDLYRMFSAMLNFAADHAEGSGRPTVNPRDTAISVIARDPAGHGLLCRTQGKAILIVAGTPAQMGAAQGTLLREPARRLTERVVYLIGAADTLHSHAWFFDRMAEIERRTTPHIPSRFLEECDALSKAAGVSQRDGRYANLFPERFHCSGVALKGKATAGGRVLHARVLDYMTEIDLQDAAVLQVFMPEGRNAWMSLGYAGFIGTVTAMNEKGLAIGEMGGRGEGQWDGTPMSLLLRDVMERASTVEEGLAILRNSPRTCEYYYILSDRSGTIRAVECRPKEITVLEPGQQDPRLAHIPPDTVIISGEDRSKVLSQRIDENYGRIDVAKLIEIIKRPAAMQSNLHDAILAPETLEMWFADASRTTPACDEPYAHANLRELLDFYRKQIAVPQLRRQ